MNCTPSSSAVSAPTKVSFLPQSTVSTTSAREHRTPIQYLSVMQRLHSLSAATVCVEVEKNDVSAGFTKKNKHIASSPVAAICVMRTTAMKETRHAGLSRQT